MLITSLTANGIVLDNVVAICTDNAPYCKAAYRILKPMLPNSTHEENYGNLQLLVAFIADSCPRIMTYLTAIENSKTPIATRAWDILDGLNSFLRNGCTKVLFGDFTDPLLRTLDWHDKNEYIAMFHSVFLSALQKLTKHWDQHPARDIYKAACLFDPRLVPALPRQLDAYTAVGLMETPAASDDWFRYRADAIRDAQIYKADGFNVQEFWKGSEERYPEIAAAANQ